MSITSVAVTVADDTQTLEQTDSIYSGELTSPEESGDYDVLVSAYDDAGNVAISNENILKVSLWSEPKTNWKSTDRFNYYDYNRIKNNLIWLYEKAIMLWKPFEIEDMGDNLIYEQEPVPYDFERFNQFERNLEIINQSIFTKDYGYSQTFFGNGPFIKYDELNRIESAILNMRIILDNQEVGLRILSFRLGDLKGVRV